jgi:hypothetical protein
VRAVFDYLIEITATRRHYQKPESAMPDKAGS